MKSSRTTASRAGPAQRAPSYGPVRSGFQAFLLEGGEGFGAVRMVTPTELVVYVENAGDFVIDAKAVKRVHDGKVIVNEARIDERLRNAIKHAHDRES
jgi:hypothetical protein